MCLCACACACVCVSLSLSLFLTPVWVGVICACVFVCVSLSLSLSLSDSLSLSLSLAQAPSLSAAVVRPSCLLRESSACHGALHAAPNTHSLYTLCRSSFPVLAHFVFAPANPARQQWTQHFRRDRHIHRAPPNIYQHARVLHRKTLKTLEDLVNLLRREVVFVVVEVVQPFLPGRVLTASSSTQRMREAISKIPVKWSSLHLHEHERLTCHRNDSNVCRYLCPSAL